MARIREQKAADWRLVEKTREPQYQSHLNSLAKEGRVQMGVVSSDGYRLDPWRIAFTASRYKFVAAMLCGLDRVLEVGCGDAFYSRLVASRVRHLTVTDFDPYFVEEAKNHSRPPWLFETQYWDVSKGSFAVVGTDSAIGKSQEIEAKRQVFDAIYALDVVEHIERDTESVFFMNISLSLSQSGVFLFGTPSLESQPYASPLSKEGHVNCKSQRDWIDLSREHFQNVFAFSMNDEVVHTGFSQMAHYLLFLCVTPKRIRRFGA